MQQAKTQTKRLARYANETTGEVRKTKLTGELRKRCHKYETTANASGGLLCVRDTFITCNVRSSIMVRHDYLMSRSVETTVAATMRVG